MDQPEDDEPEYELVYPFVACQSQGGPYEDQAFVAGVQLGKLTQSLEIASTLGVERLTTRTIYTSLVPQVELAGMAYGFPFMSAEECGDEAPEWSYVTFSVTTEEDE